MNKFKFLLDILMLFIIVLILNVSTTGVLLHEVLGISIWVLFIVHLFVNRKWIKAITKSFLSNKLKNKVKYIYIIDVLLFIDFLLITVTGIGISQKLFTYLNVSDIYLFTNLHVITTYIAGGLIGTHLIMHFAFIKAQITSFLNKRVSNSLESPTVLSSILVFASIVIIFFSIVGPKGKPSTIISSGNSIANDNNSNNDSAIVEDVEPAITLAEYLGSLVCTACRKRCPLSNPKCSRGEVKAKAATEEYYQLYQ